MFILRSRVLDRRGFDTLYGCSGDGETALLSKGEVWGEVDFLLPERNSSLVLIDFLEVRRLESMKEWRSCLDGELGGVVNDRFSLDPC